MGLVSWGHPRFFVGGHGELEVSLSDVRNVFNCWNLAHALFLLLLQPPLMCQGCIIALPPTLCATTCMVPLQSKTHVCPKEHVILCDSLLLPAVHHCLHSAGAGGA